MTTLEETEGFEEISVYGYGNRIAISETVLCVCKRPGSEDAEYLF